MKKAISLISIITVLLISSYHSLSVSASTNLFTLGTIPTVAREVSGTNNANVATAEAFIAALTNQAVNQITMTSNITISTQLDVMGQEINRDLRIVGNGFTLTIGGNGLYGENSTDPGAGHRKGVLFNLGTNGSSGVFHIRNLILRRLSGGADANTIISVVPVGTSSNWDVILEDFDCNEPTNKWHTIFDTPWNSDNRGSVFLRNNINLTATGTQFAPSTNFVVERNAKVKLHGTMFGNIRPSLNNTLNIFFASGSESTLEAGTSPFGALTDWRGNTGTISFASNVDIYNGASVHLLAQISGNTTVAPLVSDSNIRDMNFRIDNGGTLKVEQLRNGSALNTNGSFPLSILGNPGSTFEALNSHTTSTVDFRASTSKITLHSPTYYNIENKGAGVALAGTHASNSFITLRDTNIGVWQTGTNTGGTATPPSPFVTSTLIAGVSGLHTGSSNTINSLPGGWSTTNTTRLATAGPIIVGDVVITAQNITTGINQTTPISYTVTPADSSLTFVSNNPAIATVSATGSVTSVAAGSTTIRINGTRSGYNPAERTITVTVTNNPPTLIVPKLTIVNLNGTFNPKTGVSANDTEEGNLTNSIVVTGNVNTNVTGVYTINYSITDRDGNNATARQVVVVADEQIAVGDINIIHVNNFEKLVADVIVSDAAILEASQPKVYNRDGELLPNAIVKVKNNGGYSSTPGKYRITLFVEGDPTSEVIVNATVIGDNSPVITLPNNGNPVLVPLGNTFNPFDGVTVTDVEDDLNGVAITKSSTPQNINTNIAGVYQIELTAQDSDSNVSNLTRVIVVDDGTYVIGNTQIIHANDFSKSTTTVINTDAAIIEAAQPKLYDNDGNLLTNATIVVKDKGGYTNQAGTYQIELASSTDASAKITIIATVTSDNSPIITLPNSGNPVLVPLGSTFNPFDGVTVTDVEDDLKGVAIIKSSTPQNINTNIAGVYQIELTAQDSDSNVSNLTRVIVVDDGTYVIGNTQIIHANDFSKSTATVINTDAAIIQAAKPKLYDNDGNLLTNATIVVKDKGGYTNQAGTYQIELASSTDASAKITIIATVTSDNSPVITLPNNGNPVLVPIGSTFNPFDGVTVTDVEDDLNGVAITKSSTPQNINTNIAGVYQIILTAQDSDSNVSNLTRVIVVDDGTYVIGNTQIIHANDFSKSTATVINTDAAIIQAAKPKLYDNDGNLLTNATIVVKDKGGYTNQAGTYQIELASSTDASAKITIIATVTSDNSPVITLPNSGNPVLVPLGSTFDPFDGVTVTDVEDDLKGVAIIKSSTPQNINTNIAGVYQITLTARDSDSNVSNLTRVVVVDDGTYVIGNTQIIHAKDFTKAAVDVIVTDEAIIQAAKPKLYDNDGNLLTNATIVVKDKGGYTSQAGTYQIELASSTDASAKITIIATVTSDNSPIITLPNSGNPVLVPLGSTFDPFDSVTVTDVEDDLNELVITTWSTPDSVNTSVAGVYQIILSAQDSDDNVTTINRVIVVDDGTYVIGTSQIIHANDFTKAAIDVEISDTAILQAAQSKLYDNGGNLIQDANIIIEDDGGYTNKAGVYKISLASAIDSTANITIEATVTSDSSPVITLPNNGRPSSITVGKSFNPFDDVIVSDIEDDLNGIEILTSASPETIDTSKAGVYQITLSAQDSDKNITTVTRVIVVNDGSYVIGNVNIIHANNFEKAAIDVITSDEAILEAANSKVYGHNGNLLTNAIINVEDNGGYTNVGGIYNITLASNSDSSAKIIIKATVTSDNIPVITLPNNGKPILVPLGSIFNAFDDVTVTDVEDDLRGVTIETWSNPNIIDTSIAGVFKITLSAQDSDNNITTIQRVIVVDNGTYVIGNLNIIHANNFEKSEVQVIVSDEAILDASRSRLYDHKGDPIVNGVINVKDKGGYTNVSGEYKITLASSTDATAEIVISATVLSFNKPVITIPNNGKPTLVPINNSFNAFDDVIVTDVEDDLNGIPIIKWSTPEIIDTSIAGVYQIMLFAQDSDDNITSINRVIVVDDGTYFIGETDIIHASDFQKQVSAVIVSDAAILEASQPRLYDYNGNMLINGLVNVKDNGGYSAKEGIYQISLVSSNDETAIRSITAQVISGNSPEIMLPNDGNPISIAIGSSFDNFDDVKITDFEDDRDGVKVDTWSTPKSINTNVAGVYQIKLHALDSDNNMTSVQRVVVVNDGTYVLGNSYIIHANDFEKSVSQVIESSAAIIDSTKAKVYNNNGNLQPVNSVTVIDSGGYTNKVGVYTITLGALEDESAQIAIKATVKQGSAPIITLPNNGNPISIPMGSSFDNFDDVTITDLEDDKNGVEIKTWSTPAKINTNIAGVYQVQLFAQDSDNNVTSIQRVIVINDGTYVIGDHTIIHANDFEKYVSNVNTNDDAITIASQARIYDYDGNLSKNYSISITDTNGYKAEVGSYNITLAAQLDNKAQITVVGTVIAGHSPVITLPNSGNPISIPLGSSFEPYDDVIVTDIEDDANNLSIIQSTSPDTIDTNIPGVYQIQLSARDSDNNITKIQRVVVVNDGSYVIGKQYIINANDFSVTISNVNTDPEVIKVLAKLKTYDLQGNITKVLVNVDSGNFSSLPGAYDITLSVEKDNSTSITIIGSVINGNIPKLLITEFTEIKVGTTFNPNDFILEASDIEDGDLTTRVVTNYTSVLKIDVPGVYIVNYMVVDNDKNTVKADLVVLVNDGSFAYGSNYIIRAQNFNLRLSEVVIDETALIEKASVSVYDKNTGMSLYSTLVNVDYGIYTAKLGEYDITFSVNDDLQASKTVIAQVQPGAKPVLEIEKITVIKVNQDFDLTSDIKAIDTEDGDITKEILINSEPITTNVVGVYPITYSVTDTDKNTATFTRIIIVDDGSFRVGNTHIIQAYDFEINSKNVNVDDNAILQEARFKAFYIETGSEISNSGIVLDKGGYRNEDGTYSIKLSTTEESDLTISIKASVISDPPKIVPPKPELPDTGYDMSSSLIRLSLMSMLLLIVLVIYKRNYNNNRF